MKTKLKRIERTRSMRIEADTHRRIKHISVDEVMPIEEIVNIILVEWLNRNESKPVGSRNLQPATPDGSLAGA